MDKQFSCRYCNDLKLDYDDVNNGIQACQDCATIRNTNPAMFDLLEKMMEQKLDYEIECLRNYVDNGL